MANSHLDIGSPYLKPDRLQIVIALIQAMAARDKYKDIATNWRAKVFFAAPDLDLQNVLREHPEFFRQSPTEPDKWSLVQRRFMPRAGLNDSRGEQGERIALNDTQVKMLVDLAIGLHAKQVEQYKDRRWFISLALPALGTLLGAVLGATATIAGSWLKAPDARPTAPPTAASAPAATRPGDR
ncbi:hypothetical protein GCM10009416_39360 [Craurococcus roseus]|uniref:Uncharacterized protein n=1 Tax=Craurococcus roseus TaxID=77585 RepID=A0ABP3R0Q1_9PROT